MSSKIENITKQLRSEINQNIKSRIRLINYRSDLPDILNESLSVYKLNGISKVNKPYEFEVVFVSEKFIEEYFNRSLAHCSPKNMEEVREGKSCFEKDGKTLKPWWKRWFGL